VLLNRPFDVLCYTGVVEYNTGIVICERQIEVLSYVAYVRKVLPYVLPYGREKCVSPSCHAKREEVLGTVVYSPDPKEKLFLAVPNQDTHI
jgi:hypothetical protein